MKNQKAGQSGADLAGVKVEKERAEKSEYIALWNEQVQELGRLNWNLQTAGRVKLADIQAELYKLVIEASEERDC